MSKKRTGGFCRSLVFWLTSRCPEMLFSVFMNAIQSAEILSVGTELLLGEIVDTNSAYLASELANRGVDVYWSQRVGDNLERIAFAVQQALARSDLLILTGGLGPTDDDMTREAIAHVMGEMPQVDAALERDLREKFARFAREMPEKNLKQAWLIPSAETLANPVGTAPGWFVTTLHDGKNRFIVTLPGPPRELKRMWTKEVLPKLVLPSASLFTRSFKTLGWGESMVAEKLGELTLNSNPSVATYAKRDGVHVRVAAKAANDAEAKALALPVIQEVEGILQPVTWGTDTDDLPELIMEVLNKNEWKLATLESFTGGFLSHLLSSVSSSVTTYAGSVLAYNMQARAALSITNETLKEVDFTPGEEMTLVFADALKHRFDADVGLAVTASSNEASEKETVFIAVKGKGFEASQHLDLPRISRAWLRERASFAALFLLWSHLKEAQLSA